MKKIILTMMILFFMASGVYAKDKQEQEGRYLTDEEAKRYFEFLNKLRKEDKQQKREKREMELRRVKDYYR
jgi:ABC-type transporter MlaC component